MCLARDLGRMLLQPWIDPSAQTVAICPEDNLWRAPWTVCLSTVSKAEVVLALHPSLSGVADFSPSPGAKAVLWVNRAKDLYHAATEEDSFMRRFPHAAVCRTAGEARESLQGDVDLLHVIGHGKHNESNPMFSSLQFEDGSIYAAEIAKSRIRPRFVALSACETGSLSAAFRTEPDGFARAFLARGAKSVIGSLWPLDDEAASLAYETFYGHLTGGSTVVESLRHARQAVRDWNPHPYFWGSLVLFGGHE
jgi:CHAT domain-containing protein